MPLDPELAGLLQFIEGAPPMSEGTPAQAREAYRKLTVGMRQSVIDVADVQETEVTGAEGPLPARVYRPAGQEPFPTVVLFHGGGFVIGDLDTHDNLARGICASAGAVVVSVDYRLAPEHPFPAAPRDAIAATTNIASRLAQFGGSEVLAVAGDSAGGNLSAVVARQVQGIAAQFLIYPATDVPGDYPSREENATGYFLDAPTLVWFLGHFAPAGSDLTDPLMSPIHGRVDGLPPAVVVTAEFDPLRDEGGAYAAALIAAGVEVDHHCYPGMIHGFIDMGGFSAGAQLATDDALARFAKLLAGVS
jgi:acetyl esterase